MNRRQAIKTVLTASVSAWALRPGRISAQEANTSTPADVVSTIHLHPERGSDSNSGQKDSPLKTLAAAARRVNGSKGETAVPSSSKTSEKPVEIELDQTKRDYLHVVAGTPGSEIGAGLFTARA